MNGLSALCEVIERNRQTAEEDARLAPEVLAMAGGAGLWMLAAPKEVGGLELSLTELAEVLAAVARADPTVAWHAMNSFGLASIASGQDDDVRRAVVGNGDRPFGYSGIATQARASRENGGFRLVGGWPFMTGAADAGWALVNGLLEVRQPRTALRKSDGS